MFENKILISLLPIIVMNIIALATMGIFAIIYQTRPRDTTVPKFIHKTFIGAFIREYVYWVTYPFIYLFIKLKLTPNVLTLISPFIAALSGYFYYKGNIAAGGWILFASGVLDGLDGRLARATNRITKEGAFLDSNLDRFSDGFMFAGLALYFSNNLPVLLVTILSIIGTGITSYSKARGECYGIITKIGLMQRSERFALLGLTSVFHPFIMLLLNRFGIYTEYPIIIALVLMAILTNYTAIVRIVYVFNEIRKKP